MLCHPKNKKIKQLISPLKKNILTLCDITQSTVMLVRLGNVGNIGNIG
jgi:hypothetical protein